MARDLSCQTGLTAYKTKGDAVAALAQVRDRKAPPTNKRVHRCDRCRWWHHTTKGKIK